MDAQSFKDLVPFEERKAKAARLLERYPDRVPVVLLAGSPELVLTHTKLSVTRGGPMGGLIQAIRTRVKSLGPAESLYCFVDNKLFSGAQTVEEVYEAHAEPDQILYISVAKENAFGGQSCSLDRGDGLDHPPSTASGPRPTTEEKSTQNRESIVQRFSTESQDHSDRVIRVHSRPATRRVHFDMGQQQSTLDDLMRQAGLTEEGPAVQIERVETPVLMNDLEPGSPVAIFSPTHVESVEEEVKQEEPSPPSYTNHAPPKIDTNVGCVPSPIKRGGEVEQPDIEFLDDEEVPTLVDIEPIEVTPCGFVVHNHMPLFSAVEQKAYRDLAVLISGGHFQSKDRFITSLPKLIVRSIQFVEDCEENSGRMDKSRIVAYALLDVMTYFGIHTNPSDVREMVQSVYDVMDKRKRMVNRAKRSCLVPFLFCFGSDRK